jgi:hypothetical protein
MPLEENRAMIIRRIALLLGICLALSGFSTAADISDGIGHIFHPYAQGKPAIEGLPPGSKLSSTNWQTAREFLPNELLERVRAGELEIRVQETTDLPLSDAYIEATRRDAGSAKLGTDGRLEGYIAGCPFPLLDPADPQSGLKAAWSLRHRDFSRAAEAWGTFRSIQSSGKVDREIEFYYAIAYGMHRPPPADTRANRWQQSGVLFKEFYQALAPFDVKDMMALKLRYDDDQRSDDDWAYVPTARKVRHLSVRHDDATMQSDLLNEDFFGFSGYVHAHGWKFLGRQLALVPFGIRSSRATVTESRWYPADPWEVREVLLLEGTPQSAEHPYGRRLLYVDLQTGAPLYVLVFDREGVHLKTLFILYGNPSFVSGNEAVRQPVWLGESTINHRTAHATVTLLDKVVLDADLPDDAFTIDRMVAAGH